jgi:hypothetical protein
MFPAQVGSGDAMKVPARQNASGARLRHGTPIVVLLITVATLLELSAATGLAYLAGFASVRAALGRFSPVWLAALAGSLAISFVGYYYAYHGIFSVEGGPSLTGRQMRAVVVAGFGGFFAHGASRLDRYALEAAGADRKEAMARTAALAGTEYGVLALGGTATAIASLVSGLNVPPDFTIPWAVTPVPGFGIAFWFAERYRERFRGQPGWRSALGTFLRAVHLIRELFAHPLRWGWAAGGMALFWVADAFSMWAGLAMFGFKMNGAALFVGFATGMVFTRRTGPLGGAGILTLVLPVTIWYCGAPLPVAVVGAFAYRLLAFWLPLPASMAALPALRAMVKDRMRLV